MAFKENLIYKIRLDGIVHKLVSTIEDPAAQHRLDKALIRELLAMTDLEHRKVRDLDFYVRPVKGETMEALLLDNELPTYHSTLKDIAMRKSPLWREVLSIKNIKKIMNTRDVVVCRGKESLERIHAYSLAMLDLTYTRNDLALLLEDARLGLAKNDITQIRETLDLFFELLDFLPVFSGVTEQALQTFARPRPSGNADRVYEHLILFNEKRPSIGMRKGPFSPQNEADLVWLRQYARGKEPGDLQGMEVFEFLADLALKKVKTPDHHY